MEKFLSDSYSIEFAFNNITKFPFPEDDFRKWILAIIDNENEKPGELNFIFCDDDFIYEINKKYLDHDTFTDIITFDYSEDFGNVSGDIYVSIDRIKDNANQYKVEFQEELARVIAHGVLHIIGYKDKTVEETEIMRKKENDYLQIIDFL